MKKRDSIIIIIVLILLLGGWIWFGMGKDEKAEEMEKQEVAKQEEVTKTEQEKSSEIDMSDWKTYKDEKYGFEVRYPSTHFIDEHPYTKKTNVMIRDYEMVEYLKKINYPPASEGNNIIISVLENKNNLSLINWAIENNELYSLACNNKDNPKRIICEKGGIDSQVKLININNKEALLINEYSIMSNSIVLFGLKNKIVQFYYNGNIDHNDGNNFFMEMMKSFRII